MFNIRNILIIGLAAALAYVILINPNPFPGGSTGVTLGFVLSDGSEVTVRQGERLDFTLNPDTLTLYADASMRVTVDQVFAELTVYPESDAPTSQVSWDGVVSLTGAPPTYGNGTELVNSNTSTLLNNSRISVNADSVILQSSGELIVLYQYDVSATSGEFTDTTAVQGQMSVWWSGSTFSITASVTGGTLSLMG